MKPYIKMYTKFDYKNLSTVLKEGYSNIEFCIGVFVMSNRFMSKPIIFLSPLYMSPLRRVLLRNNLDMV